MSNNAMKSGNRVDNLRDRAWRVTHDDINDGDTTETLEASLLAFLERTYQQYPRNEKAQAAGLQFIVVEVHELAADLAKFIETEPLPIPLA